MRTAGRLDLWLSFCITSPYRQSSTIVSMPSISSLECSRCHHHVTADIPQTVCPLCGSFLYVLYDMDELKRTAKREDIASRAAAGGASRGMWRYAGVLPDINPVTLGEGWTPLLRSSRYPGLYLKNEGANPTGTFAARGFGLAVTMAKHYGIQQASAVSGAGTLAAYAAAAGMNAHVSMPEDVPLASYVESAVYGARPRTKEAYYDVSALKEPFWLEGAKTVGYEVVEQLGWEYPDAVICPTATAVLAIWKAFEEMEQLGWVAGKRPRIFALADEPEPLVNNPLIASGGRVVKSAGETILASLLDWGREEGVFLSLAGAAAAAAYGALVESGELTASEKVVLINPCAGLRDAEEIARKLRLRLPVSLPVGGIITPQ